MSMLKFIEIIPTGRVFPGELDVEMSAECELEKGPESYFPENGREYKLQACLCVMFVADGVEYPSAVRRAKQQLMHEVYKDVISALYDAMDCRSQKESQKVLSTLLDDIRRAADED